MPSDIPDTIEDLIKETRDAIVKAVNIRMDELEINVAHAAKHDISEEEIKRDLVRGLLDTRDFLDRMELRVYQSQQMVETCENENMLAHEKLQALIDLVGQPDHPGVKVINLSDLLGTNPHDQ